MHTMKSIGRWQRELNHSTTRCLNRLQPNAQSAQSQIGQRHQTRHAATYRRQRKLLNIAPSATHGGSPIVTGSSGRSRSAQQPVPESDHIIFDPPPSAPNVYHTPSKFLPKQDLRRRLMEQEQASYQASRAAMTASSPGSPPPWPPSSTSSIEPATIPASPSPTAFPSPPTSFSSSKSPSNPASWSSSTSQAPASIRTQNQKHQPSTSQAGAPTWPEPQPLPPPVKPAKEKQYHLTAEQIEEIRQLRQQDEKKYTRGRLAQMFNCSPLFVGIIVHASEKRRERMKQVHLANARKWAQRGTVSVRTREDRRKRKEAWGLDS